MKVRISFDLDDEDRLAINNYYGRPGKADRKTCAAWLATMALSDLDVALGDERIEDGTNDSKSEVV